MGSNSWLPVRVGWLGLNQFSTVVMKEVAWAFWVPYWYMTVCTVPRFVDERLGHKRCSKPWTHQMHNSYYKARTGLHKGKQIPRRCCSPCFSATDFAMSLKNVCLSAVAKQSSYSQFSSNCPLPSCVRPEPSIPFQLSHPIKSPWIYSPLPVMDMMQSLPHDRLGMVSNRESPCAPAAQISPQSAAWEHPR